MRCQSLRGMRDIIGEEAEKISSAEKCARKIFRSFNYEEVRLPIMEEASLFLRGIGDTSDIVEKQLYIFKDKGERTVALRPEGTASAVRCYIQNNLHNLPLTKIFYCGSMFRYERPQEGRYREFYQIGCEYFGNPHYSADVEIILLAHRILSECGAKKHKIFINSVGCRECRPGLSAAIAEYADKIKNGLCSDCQRRARKNPLRILDCKVDSAKLENFPESFSLICPNCLRSFNGVKNLLGELGVSAYLNPKLVRGLDYYTGTVFEITSELLGAQSTIAAGGRYDRLVEELGGKQTPAVGFALGAERLALASEPINNKIENKYFIIAEDENFLSHATKLGNALREKNIITEWPLLGRSFKSQLNCANKLNFDFVIIFSDEHFDKNEIIIKKMSDGTQKVLEINSFLENL